MKSQQSKRSIPWFLLTVFLLFVLGILITGILYYQTQQQHIKTEAQNNLVAIADMKVEQLARWRQERLIDARLVYNNASLIHQVSEYFKTPEKSGARQEILNLMKFFHKDADYKSVLLLDTKGKVRLSVSQDNNYAGSYEQKQFQEILLHRQVVISDLHQSKNVSFVHLDLIIPLLVPDRSDSTVIGALLLHIDPNDILFPLIKSWPTTSRTSETLLLEQDGDSIVYLNELRHNKNTTLTLHLPISNEQLPASMAVRGIQGTVEGVDYRGVPVLAAIRPIPDSPWYMIAKVDQEEIYEPVRSQIWIVGIGIFLIILSTGSIIGFWWRHQRAIFYRKQYEAELEHKALITHFDYIIKYTNDSILLIDMNGKIVEANDQACRMYGYTREELFHLTINDLRSQQTRSQVEKQMKQVEERGGLVFETEHRRKDGTAFSAEVSSRFIKIEGTKFYQSIIRDITERKQAEESLTQSLSLLKATLESTTDGLLVIDRSGKITGSNEQFAKMWNIPKDIISSGDDNRALNYVLDQLIEPDKFINKVRDLYSRPEDDSFDILEFKNGNIFERYSHPQIIKGIPVGRVWSFRDITDRKRAEDIIIESEERFRRIFEEGHLGMATVGSNFKFIKANAYFCRMMGYEENELISLTFKDITHPEHLAQDIESINRLLAGDIPIYRTEKRYLRKDKNIVWGSVTITILRDKNKRFLYFIALIEDITERKRAAEALRESEEQFRSLAEQSPNMIFINSKGRVVFANKRCEDIMEYTKEEFYSPDFNFINLASPEYRSTIEENFKRHKKGENVPPLDYTLLTKSGKRIEAILATELIIYNKENAILGIVTDITERKHTEEELRKSERLFKTLVEFSPVSIAVFSGQNQSIEYVSHRFTELFGYKQADLPSLSAWWSIAYPMEEYRNQIKSTWHNSIEWSEKENREPEPIESVITCKDGSTKYIESTFTSMSDYTLIFFSDLTQRRMAEEALRQTHAFNDLLIQTMPFGMNIVDEDGNILFVSKTMKEMLTVDVVDMCCWQVYKDDNQQCQNCPLKRGISFGKPDVIETTGVLGGKTFQISYVGMMYEGRKAMLEVFQDITEQKKLQQELVQSQKMLSIGTLAGGIAHDFNNILAIILGYTSILHSMKENPQKFSDGVNAIKQAVERGAALVRQILTFARKTDVAFEPMSISDLAKELISMLQQTFPRIITFNKEIETQLPLINADYTQIHQILLNLCVNARDAMPNGGIITIKSDLTLGEKLQERFPEAKSQFYVCIAVSDTGTGMDETTRNRIFDPFFTTKEKGKGTGLGLSVVYGVVQAHNGFVDVDSTVGTGTTFRLYLPVPKESSAAIESSQVEEQVRGGTETLLVVEDEDLLLDMVQILLETNGYTVLTARDGMQAVEVYSQHANEIALVISDMGLPILSGEGEFIKLKEINPDVIMILASGYFEPDIKATLESAGVRGFLQKPYIIEDVLAKIRKALD